MLSKKSYFNAVLYRKNLTRFWPLWGGLSLVGSVVPLYMLLMLMNYGGDYVSNRSVSSAIYAVVCTIVPAGLLVYAALCGVLCWGYLANNRSAGLYHTLPVSRTCLFLTTLASGLTMMLLPFVIVGGLSILVLLFWGGFPLEAIFWAALMVIGMSLLFFSLITFAAMVSGNSFAVLAFYFLGNFLAPALDLLLTTFARGFLFGVSSEYTGKVEFFSPVVFLYQHLGTMFLDDKDKYVLQGTWVVGVYALVALAILAVSLLLYHRRKSESAGDVVAQNWLKPIFRYGVALLFGLTLGQVLYELVYALPFGGGQYKHMIPMAICIMLTAVVGYYVASMLLKKSLRVFQNSWKGALTTIAMVVILCGCVSFDIFGSVGYVPDLQDVERISVYGINNSFDTAGDSALAEQVTDLHRAILKEEAYIRDMTSQGDPYTFGYGENSDTSYQTLSLVYEMKNGSTVRRRYTLVLVEDRWNNQPDTFDYKLRQTICGPEAAIAQVTPEHGGSPEGLYARYWDGSDPDLNLRGEAARKVYEALLADAAAGNTLSYDIFSGESTSYLGYLEFYFPYDEEYGQESIALDLTSSMTSTLAALEEVSPSWYEAMLEANDITSVSLGTATMET